MKTPETIQKFFMLFFLVLFWFFAGFLLAPFWLIISIAGALIGAIDWEEVPGMFWYLVTIKWFTEG
jgi:hypothetical protein